MNHQNSNHARSKNKSYKNNHNDSLTQEELMLMLQMTNDSISTASTTSSTHASVTPSTTLPSTSSTTSSTKPKTCEFEGCMRKLNILTEYQCKCKKCFCNQHRFFDDHKCTYDYKEEHRRELEKKNPVVKRDKIEKI